MCVGGDCVGVETQLSQGRRCAAVEGCWGVQPGLGLERCGVCGIGMWFRLSCGVDIGCGGIVGRRGGLLWLLRRRLGGDDASAGGTAEAAAGRGGAGALCRRAAGFGHAACGGIRRQRGDEVGQQCDCPAQRRHGLHDVYVYRNVRLFCSIGVGGQVFRSSTLRSWSQ